ncbi:MAG TPA: TIGR00730 family Rossman fold protein [Stellaceae bacterium]|nr:TIGR00730 family Rossman fold protein [Stellaceae bacterium]
MAAIKRLCVYCGSSRGAEESYRQAAMRLGTLMADAGIELIYGGGRVGLMGLLADAALAGNGRVTGVIPAHLYEREVAHPNARLVVVASMHERKQRMFDLADGFAILPGGLGTLDETIEIVTWRQLGLHDKPVVLVDVAGYWAPLAALIEHTIAHGFAPPAARGYFRILTHVEDVLPTFAALPEPKLKGDSSLA